MSAESVSATDYDTRDTLSYIEFLTTEMTDIKSSCLVIPSDFWEVVLVLLLLCLQFLSLELLVLETISSYFSHWLCCFWCFKNFVLEILGADFDVCILNLTSNNY